MVRAVSTETLIDLFWGRYSIGLLAPFIWVLKDGNEISEQRDNFVPSVRGTKTVFFARLEKQLSLR